MITLEKGIYKENHIQVKKNLTLMGNGKADDVIIDGENKNVIIKSDSPIKLTIKNITFVNAFYEGNGGAISFYNKGELIIENCNFISNKVSPANGEALGGAIYTHGEKNKYVNLIVSNSKFINNSADTDGGAINGKFAAMNITNCLFDQNHAIRDGGAISTRGLTNAYINGCIFTNNRVSEWGGAINNWLSRFIIDKCIFINNTALVEGGAISTCGSLTSVTNSRIINNSASEIGGAINIHKDALEMKVTLNNNEITGNSAPKGSQINIKSGSDGDYDFEDNYWGNVTANSTEWNALFSTNGMCSNPTKFAEKDKWSNLTNDQHDLNNTNKTYDNAKKPDNSASTVEFVVNAAEPKADTVKLTLKTVKVKKSAKKLVLQATLKINGKTATGKLIKFKFNGKIYKARTKRNGIAKVTIKKQAIKKLKVGKKVKYEVSYGKTAVKKTAKVKK